MHTAEELLIEQIIVIREIISRSAFHLSGKQNALIHQVFNEFSKTRRFLRFEEKKYDRLQKAYDTEMAKY